MARVVVLGAGLVGRTIARDLARVHSVTVIDRSARAIDDAFSETEVDTLVADLSQSPLLREVIEPFDLVVDALPGRLGFQTLKTVIEAGRDTVDIAFSPEDPSPLEPLARRAGVRAVVDMGVAPGMSNAILGHYSSILARVESFECLVGGLPRERVRPFEYRAPFSPADVLEEYIRPARYREAGRAMEVPALSNCERIDIPGIGSLESFDTDGLRSLLRSYPDIPDLREKTLRYPGHASLMEVFREAGFLSPEPLSVGDCTVRPIDLTSQLLFPHWQLRESDEEFTVMRVRIEGYDHSDRRQSHQWDLLDRTDFAHRDSSMARTTGFACNAAAALILAGGLEPGLWFPERLAEDSRRFEFLLDYQRERGVNYRRS